MAQIISLSPIEFQNRIVPEVLGGADQLHEGFVAVDCCGTLERLRASDVTSHLTNKELEPVIPGCIPYKDLLEGTSQSILIDEALLQSPPELEEGWKRIVLFHDSQDEEVTKKAIAACGTLEIIDSNMGLDEAVGGDKKFVKLRTIFLVERLAFLKLFPWYQKPEIESLAWLNLAWHPPSIIMLKVDPANGFEPIKRSEVVDYATDYIHGRLFLSKLGALEKKNAFGKLGIDAVMNLSSNGKNVLEVAEVNYWTPEIAFYKAAPGGGVQFTPFLDDERECAGQRLVTEVLPAALEFMRDKLLEGRNIVVHCDQGKSRSGAVIVAWEMISRFKGQPTSDVSSLYDASLACVQSYRALVQPNTAFAAALKSLEVSMVRDWVDQYLTSPDTGVGGSPMV